MLTPKPTAKGDKMITLTSGILEGVDQLLPVVSRARVRRRITIDDAGGNAKERSNHALQLQLQRAKLAKDDDLVLTCRCQQRAL